MKSPLECVQPQIAEVSTLATRAVLQAHATGLRQAAMVASDMASDLAVLDTYLPGIAQGAPREAAIAALAQLQDKIIARIKAVDVVLNG